MKAPTTVCNAIDVAAKADHCQFHRSPSASDSSGSTTADTATW